MDVWYPHTRRRSTAVWSLFTWGLPAPSRSFRCTTSSTPVTATMSCCAGRACGVTTPSALSKTAIGRIDTLSAGIGSPARHHHDEQRASAAPVVERSPPQGWPASNRNGRDQIGIGGRLLRNQQQGRRSQRPDLKSFLKP